MGGARLAPILIADRGNDRIEAGGERSQRRFQLRGADPRRRSLVEQGVGEQAVTGGVAAHDRVEGHPVARCKAGL